MTGTAIFSSMFYGITLAPGRTRSLAEQLLPRAEQIVLNRSPHQDYAYGWLSGWQNDQAEVVNVVLSELKYPLKLVDVATEASDFIEPARFFIAPPHLILPAKKAGAFTVDEAFSVGSMLTVEEIVRRATQVPPDETHRIQENLGSLGLTQAPEWHFYAVADDYYALGIDL